MGKKTKLNAGQRAIEKEKNKKGCTIEELIPYKYYHRQKKKQKQKKTSPP